MQLHQGFLYARTHTYSFLNDFHAQQDTPT